jgi:hypothetical protein
VAGDNPDVRGILLKEPGNLAGDIGVGKAVKTIFPEPEPLHDLFRKGVSISVVRDMGMKSRIESNILR